MQSYDILFCSVFNGAIYKNWTAPTPLSHADVGLFPLPLFPTTLYLLNLPTLWVLAAK